MILFLMLQDSPLHVSHISRHLNLLQATNQELLFLSSPFSGQLVPGVVRALDLMEMRCTWLWGEAPESISHDDPRDKMIRALTSSSGQSLGVLKAANHETKLGQNYLESFEEWKGTDAIYIALKTTTTTKKVELHLIENTVGISTLGAVIFHFNLQALYYFSRLCNSQQLANHLVWYACLYVFWEL